MKRFGVLLPLVVSISCGGSSPPNGPAPPPSSQPSVTITPSGISPKELTVTQGTRVLFINSDTRRRHMTSDPHPEHTDCPEIDLLIVPGQRRETENLNTVRTCGFHDHDDPNNNNVKGRIIIRQ